MTAGKINDTWLDRAAAKESPESTIEDWFADHVGCAVAITAANEVWVEATQTWLSQDSIDEICGKIDTPQPTTSLSHCSLIWASLDRT